MHTPILALRHLLVSALALLVAAPAFAVPVFFSLNADTASTPPILDADIAIDDSASVSATDHAIFFSASNFAATERIDGLHVVSTSMVALTTATAATLGGLTFQDEDIVLYDTGADTASLIFDGSTVFDSTAADVDAFHLLASGDILLSTVSAASIGGVAFNADDVVLYDVSAGTASIFFAGSSVFTSTANIDALYFRASDGALLVSTGAQESTAGATYQDGDVIEIVGGGDSVFFSSENLPGDNDIDGLFVPEPSTGLLVALGLACTAARRRTQLA